MSVSTHLSLQQTLRSIDYEGLQSITVAQSPPGSTRMQLMPPSSYHSLSSGSPPLCPSTNSLQLLFKAGSDRKQMLSTIRGDLDSSEALKAKLIEEDGIWKVVFATEGLTAHEFQDLIYLKISDYQCTVVSTSSSLVICQAGHEHVCRALECQEMYGGGCSGIHCTCRKGSQPM